MELKTIKFDKSKWVLTPLRDLATEISLRVDDPSGSDFGRFVGLDHFVSGDLKIKKWGSTENLASPAKAFEKGDILLARRNAYLRRASLVDFKGCCSGDAFVLRENHEKVVPGFLAFIVNSNGLWDYANANAAGTMSKRVKWRDLSQYELLLPPINEQLEIADLIWNSNRNVNAKIDVEKHLEILLFCELKEHFDRSFPEYIGLEKCGRWQSGGTPSRKNKSFWGGNIPWVSPKDMKVEEISSSLEMITQTAIESGAKLLPINTILMVVRGMILAHTFPVAITSNKVSFNQDMKSLQVNEHYLPEYILYFLQYKQKEVLGMVTTTTHGTKRLATDVIYELQVPKISIDEQVGFINRIKSIKSSISDCQKVIGKSKGLSKKIINEVF
ncbi:restriction endonuclease subunit S [Vibrio mediterranei]|uniref:restriction endonuclease subunit S n=1 Tax=Vibrio mediterranei TaxID=689 RepID=UPI0040696734